MRVKNRFNRSYNAAVSCGYRDVCFNIRMASFETKILGLDTHVCELQLSLLPIACIKVISLCMHLCLPIYIRLPHRELHGFPVSLFELANSTDVQ